METDRFVEIFQKSTDAWSWDAPLALISKRFEETNDPSIIGKAIKLVKNRPTCKWKNSNLEQLPSYGFKVIALPVKIKGASAGWVRAVAISD